MSEEGKIPNYDRLESVLNRMVAALDRVERLEILILSPDPGRPGIAMRLDRIERMLSMVKWIGSGGLLGLAGTLYLLNQIAQSLASAKIGL